MPSPPRSLDFEVFRLIGLAFAGLIFALTVYLLVGKVSPSRFIPDAQVAVVASDPTETALKVLSSGIRERVHRGRLFGRRGGAAK
ncbi:MAG: hypothetical protein M5R36_13525 [Deltaproteobacteria bacterium]|nr:hypothetical protein [Deltaproteobacteria bacterium]